MKFFSQLAPLTPLLALAVAFNPSGVLAATVTYQVQGVTDSGNFPFPNQSYSGVFSFDDGPPITPTYTGTVNIPDVQFAFLGENFTEADAATTPLAYFDNGSFIGWDFSVADALISGTITSFSFSFIPGSNDILESYFTYESNGKSGAGSADYTLLATATGIPEPSVSLGLLGLGLLGISRKSNNKTRPSSDN
jgi:hypothetical protein